MDSVLPKDAQELLNQGAEVIDVRSHDEFLEGHIPGAKNIGVNSFEFEIEIKKLSFEKQYILNCKTGGRSARATSLMRALGFEQAYNLVGGIMAWEQEGLPVEK